MGEPVRQEMKRLRQLVGALGGYAYSTAVSVGRTEEDYTLRVIPQHFGGGGFVGSRSNPMATLIKTLQRKLRNSIWEIRGRRQHGGSHSMDLGWGEHPIVTERVTGQFYKYEN